MHIWQAETEAIGPELRELVSRAAQMGCELVPRQLSPVHGQAAPMLLWQETDDATARVAALRAGADDVIGPWMHGDEALARTLRLDDVRKTKVRRMVLGDLDIDLVERQAHRAARPLDLLAREYQLLVFLARHADRIQSRETLLRAIWRLAFDPGTNVVQVHISRLRAKLDRGFAEPMLHTVRGAGYCLRVAT